MNVHLLHPSSNEVNRHSGVKAQKRVRREKEPFLLVRLRRQDCKPQIERRKPRDQQYIGTRLAFPGRHLRPTQSAEIVLVRHSQSRQRKQSKRHETVEIEEQVGEVECRRGSPV